ncbi:MAG: arginine--tRNA ligase [Burkholderiales bacterium]|nr:arginine--tRNA ligase [Burkholderiales bacterium]
MSAEIRSHLTELLIRALARVAPEEPATVITLERPKQARHGDFSCPAAMQLARNLKRPPRDIAQALVQALPGSEWLESAEVAGGGFINLRVRPAAKQHAVTTILEKDHAFGRSARGQGQAVMVEFVSANPTGPLHVGHGRQAALGDSIAALLESQGLRVTREFYYNDAGAQIRALALSVQARAREALGLPSQFPEDGYHGEYIAEIAQKYLASDAGSSAGAAHDLEAIRRFAVTELRAEQDRDLQAFGVRFDNHYLESSLYADGRVDATVAALVAAGKTYERDGALWLRTTEYGDDKDRVMRKSDGAYTYFVPDVAYHLTKWERGYRKVINVQGSDHHSTVTRVRIGLQALGRGIPPGYPDYVLHKMVTVMRGGEEVKISKRAGSYLTLRDLIDEAGRDATRFFLVSRKADTEFVFDLDLARSQSDENPVYYVQYAHARVCSVLEQWRARHPEEAASAGALSGADLSALTGAREIALLARLGGYGEMLEEASREQAPHQICFYLRELAADFHSYYNAERILVPEPAPRRARLALAAAVKVVIRNALALIGVGAPEKM